MSLSSYMNLKCYLWNSLDRSRCLRCNSIQGSLVERLPPRERSESRYTDLTEATRKRLPSSKTSEWPPEFSTNGSDYVFDPRSGLFYESQSNFFYDPKNTLYYGNKKGAYYRYNGTKSPPFDKVKQMVNSAGLSRTPNVVIAANHVAAEPANNKKPIEEPHQQPKGGKKKLTIKINTVAITTPGVKKQAADIERWTKKNAVEKQQENKAPEQPTTGAPSETTTPTPVTRVTAAPKPAASSQGPAGTTPPPATESKLSKDAADIVKTSVGEPICTICMRKFPNDEQLKLHETASALHKENLAKLRELERSRTATPERHVPFPMKIETTTPAPTQYVDRAKKRRNLYGESIMPPPIRATAVAPVVHAVVDPEKNLGQNSVGNKLFQKMLLKSQAAAAGGGDESSSAAAAPSTVTRLASDLTDNLRQDWARIESLAHGAMQRQRTGSSFAGGKGLGNKTPR
jgi:hypothetical protein